MNTYNSTHVTADKAIMEAGSAKQLTQTEFMDMDTVAANAGLDFTIGMAGVVFADQDGDLHSNPSAMQPYRQDNKKPLGGTVGKNFKPLQPRILLDIVNQVANESTGYNVTGAGSLDGGAGMWIIAKKDGFDLSGDKTDHSLLFTTDNTGKASSKFCQTSVRLFCTNQMPAAYRNSKHRISVRHTTDWSESYIRSIVTQINGFSDAADNLAAAADDMASTRMDDRQAVNFFAELYAERDERDNVTNETALEKIVNSVMESFKYGPGSSHIAAKGTQWGAINAVTHYIDHVTRAHSDENRFKSAIDGNGYSRKIKAIEMIQGIDGSLIERESVIDSPDTGPSFEDLLSMPV